MNTSTTPQPGDLYIAEHRLLRDRFSIVRIEHVTAQMAVMATYRPKTKYNLKHEGDFEPETRRRRLDNLRQKLPADCDLDAIALEIDRRFCELKDTRDAAEARYLAAMKALPEITTSEPDDGIIRTTVVEGWTPDEKPGGRKVYEGHIDFEEAIANAGDQVLNRPGAYIKVRHHIELAEPIAWAGNLPDPKDEA